MPELHEILNIFADKEEGGKHPPMPAMSTIMDPPWVDLGRYHFYRTDHFIKGFDFANVDRWWRYGHNVPVATTYGGTPIYGTRWDYAGYKMQDQLWTGDDSPERKFLNGLNDLVGVAAMATGDLASTSYDQSTIWDVSVNAASLDDFLETYVGSKDSGLLQADHSIDVPESAMRGSAAAAFAARLYDLAMRMSDLSMQLHRFHNEVNNLRGPLLEKLSALVEARDKAFSGANNTIKATLDNWYNNVSAGSEVWNSERGQFAIMYHADPPTYGIVGDSITDHNVNQVLKKRWLDNYQPVITAANDLYTTMLSHYQQTSVDLVPIREPLGGLPPGYSSPTGPGDGDGTPDWLKDLLNNNPPPDVNGPGDGDGTPDWLKDLLNNNPPPDVNGPGDGDGDGTPDWLRNLLNNNPPPDVNGPGDGGGGGNGDGGPELNTTPFDLTGPGGDDLGGNNTPLNLSGLGTNDAPNGLDGNGSPLDLTGPGGGDGPGGAGTNIPLVSSDPGLNTNFDTGDGIGGTGGGVPPLGGLMPPVSGPGSTNGRNRGSGPGLNTNFPSVELDPATGLPLNPDTGEPYPLDPDTGLPYNPDTGLPINYDPDTGQVDLIDPITGQPIDTDSPVGSVELDPATGLPLNPDTGEPYPLDPDTGLPYNPDTGLPINYDPDTGQVTPINPITGQPVDTTAPPVLELDPATGLPLNPDTGEPYPLDPDTGLPYNPDTGLPINYDPDTGQVDLIDPITGQPVTYDPGTGEFTPIDPATREPLDLDGPGGDGSGYQPPDYSDLVTDDPGLGTNFGSDSDGPGINPITGEPYVVDPETGLPYPIDPETGEPITTGFDVSGPGPDPTSGIPRLESSDPYGLNFGGADDGSSGGGTGGAPRTVDRSALFNNPVPNGSQLQAGGGPGAQTGGENASAATSTDATAPSMPMMPPMMGGMGGGMGGGDSNRDRQRSTWLSEDERVWGTANDKHRSVLGRPVPGQNKKGTTRHEFIDAGADGSGVGTTSHDDGAARGRKRKPGGGNRRGRGQEQARGGEGGRDGRTD
ncbi:hypothetical protein [Nocardiopsis sp. FR26]|uniref:hypothetical protein n=1 Tax=Nocardiopsis sp. FR26 TaxID=2605987 RepID=UPI001F26A973|nr:hypothetical protein [Nocardiopsis sp. FR26]